ncbi:hypothetical protein HOD29_02305 [archaeon]|jgi:hypothetical protein|nr:hypothetical protein [archaeon]
MVKMTKENLKKEISKLESKIKEVESPDFELSERDIEAYEKFQERWNNDPGMQQIIKNDYIDAKDFYIRMNIKSRLNFVKSAYENYDERKYSQMDFLGQRSFFPEEPIFIGKRRAGSKYLRNKKFG